MKKINSDFDTTGKVFDYFINQDFQDNDKLKKFVDTSVDGVGKLVYEHIKNFTANVKDIDVCS